MLAVSRRLASISDFGTNAAIHSGKAALAELTERRPGARRFSSDRKCSTSLVKLLTDFATNTDVKAFDNTARPGLLCAAIGNLQRLVFADCRHFRSSMRT